MYFALVVRGMIECGLKEPIRVHESNSCLRQVTRDQRLANSFDSSKLFTHASRHFFREIYFKFGRVTFIEMQPDVPTWLVWDERRGCVAQISV